MPEVGPEQAVSGKEHRTAVVWKAANGLVTQIATIPVWLGALGEKAIRT